MKRPLFLVALFYACGILLSRHISLPILFPYVGALMATLAALAWPRGRLILLYTACFLAGWTNYSLKTAALSPFDVRRILGPEPALATIRGTLLETPIQQHFELGNRESDISSAQLELTAIRTNNGSWFPAHGVIAVTVTHALSTNFFGGQTVEVDGVVSRPKIAAAEGLFDHRANLAEKGIYYSLKSDGESDWKILSSPPGPPLKDRFRAWAQGALALGLPVEDEPLRLEWALTLGWRQALTEDISEPFVRAATYHIFAVDGLRMAIISGIFFTILRALRVPRVACGLVLIPLIWCYTALTGWPASAVRANVMLTVVIVGWMLKRPSDTINSLYAAALIILLGEPSQMFQAGFQLSFVVVYYIILIDTPLREKFRQWGAPDSFLPDQMRPKWQVAVQWASRYPIELGISSFTAWIASAPLVAYYFHLATPVSTPANIIAIPLCFLVLICNLSSLLLAGWFPAAAGIFNNAGWLCMKLIQDSSRWFADWHLAYWYVSRPELLSIVLYYSVLLAVATGWLFRAKFRTWKLAVLALLLCGWTWHHWQAANVIRLSILPANGGMAIFFQSPRAQDDLLIDCGDVNPVQYLTKPFLRAQGVNHLPRLALTHGDLRHIGGAELVGDLFHVSKFCVSPVRFRSPAYRKFARDWAEATDKVQVVSRTNRLGAWTILHPQPTDKFPQADDNALVFDGTFNGCRVLLLSDLGRPGQDALMQRTPDLRADILVTGLPAQNEAVSEALLDAVQPKVLIVVDSENPPVEQASPKLHARLARRGIPVIYTRFAGAVTIEWREKSWELRTMSGIRMSPGHLALVPDPRLETSEAAGF